MKEIRTKIKEFKTKKGSSVEMIEIKENENDDSPCYEIMFNNKLKKFCTNFKIAEKSFLKTKHDLG